MNSSVGSSDYFLSKLPRSMLTPVTPKQASTISSPPASNITDTQFSFGKVLASPFS